MNSVVTMRLKRHATLKTCNEPNNTNERAYWLNRFCSGNFVLANEHRGRPEKVDNDELKAIVEADPFHPFQ